MNYTQTLQRTVQENILQFELFSFHNNRMKTDAFGESKISYMIYRI